MTPAAREALSWLVCNVTRKKSQYHVNEGWPTGASVERQIRSDPARCGHPSLPLARSRRRRGADL